MVSQISAINSTKVPTLPPKTGSQPGGLGGSESCTGAEALMTWKRSLMAGFFGDHSPVFGTGSLSHDFWGFSTIQTVVFGNGISAINSKSIRLMMEFIDRKAKKIICSLDLDFLEQYPYWTYLFWHVSIIWLARKVGNEGPSTFTNCYYLGMDSFPHSLLRAS